VGKILHHFVMLLHESLLKKNIKRIVYSIIFISFHRGGFLGSVRDIFLKKQNIKTQLDILRPRRGHALKNDQEKHFNECGQAMENVRTALSSAQMKLKGNAVLWRQVKNLKRRNWSLRKMLRILIL
jgi:hypothetical protein